MPSEQEQKDLVSVQVSSGRKRQESGLYVEVLIAANFSCILVCEELYKDDLIGGAEVRGFGPGVFYRTGHHIRDGHTFAVSVYPDDDGPADAVSFTVVDGATRIVQDEPTKQYPGENFFVNITTRKPKAKPD